MIAHRDTVQMRDGTRSHRDLEGELIYFILALVLKIIFAEFRLQISANKDYSFNSTDERIVSE